MIFRSFVGSRSKEAKEPHVAQDPQVGDLMLSVLYQFRK